MATTRQKSAARRNIKRAVAVSASRRRRGLEPKRGKHPLSSHAEREIPSTKFGITRLRRSDAPCLWFPIPIDCPTRVLHQTNRICSSGFLIVGLNTHGDDSKSQIVAVSDVGRPAVIGKSTDDVLCLRLIRGAGSHVHPPLLSHASSVVRHQREVGSLNVPGFVKPRVGFSNLGDARSWPVRSLKAGSSAYGAA